jgi:thiol-disulfide isomerase/thioredoxin
MRAAEANSLGATGAKEADRAACIRGKRGIVSSLARRAHGTKLQQPPAPQSAPVATLLMCEESTMHKLLSTLVLGVFLVSFAPMSHAGTPFDPQALAAAQATGKPVLVEVFADWCSTCAQQRAVLSQLLGQPAYKDYQVLTVDFDKQK